MGLPLTEVAEIVEVPEGTAKSRLSRGLETVHEGDPDDWEEMIDTNGKGLLWVSRAVLRGMVARDRGHVVNIGSISGHAARASTPAASISSSTLEMIFDLIGS